MISLPVVMLQLLERRFVFHLLQISKHTTTDNAFDELQHLRWFSWSISYYVKVVWHDYELNQAHRYWFCQADANSFLLRVSDPGS